MKSKKNFDSIKKKHRGDWDKVVSTIESLPDPECKLEMYNAINPFEVGEEIYKKVVNGREYTTGELRAQRKDLELMANTDSLTGLQNRRSFDNSIERAVESYNRMNKRREADNSKNQLSMLYFDIDYFKKFNDTFGHLAGDYVLRRLGKIIKEKFRESDICCRYGGEEFVVILPNTDENGTYIAAEYLRKTIENEKLKYDMKDIGKVTISIGVAEYMGGGVNKFIKNADDALYAAKEAGRNQTKKYSDISKDEKKVA